MIAHSSQHSAFSSISSFPLFSGHPQHNPAILTSVFLVSFFLLCSQKRSLHHPFIIHFHLMASPFQSSYFYGYDYISTSVLILYLIFYLYGFFIHLCPSSGHVLFSRSSFPTVGVPLPMFRRSPFLITTHDYWPDH
jgi:hypothetical protein